MALGKQAKTLSETQQRVVLSHLASGRHSKRNTLIFLLSVDAALRAKEIASLEWSMLTDASGALTDEIRLQDRASKGRSGGVVFMSKRLKAALIDYAEAEKLTGRVIKSQRGNRWQLKSSQTGSSDSIGNWAMRDAHLIAVEEQLLRTGRGRFRQ